MIQAYFNRSENILQNFLAIRCEWIMNMNNCFFI